MKQLTSTGALCTYPDFRKESIKPRRTERAQRQEIESSLNQLTMQGDYWSLDLIRKAAATLTDDTGAGETLYFLLLRVIYAKPGEWIMIQKK